MAHQRDDDTTRPATRFDVLSAGFPDPTEVARARRRVRAERLATQSAPPAAPPVEDYPVEVGRPGPTGHVSLFLPHVLDADDLPLALDLTPTQARDLWRALDALMEPATGSDPDDASTSAEVGLRAARDLLAEAPDAACEQVAAYAAAQARAAHLAPGPAAFHAWLQAADTGQPEP